MGPDNNKSESQENKTVFTELEERLLLAEWNHIQSIVARKSESRLKFRGFLITLLTAVIITSYSQKIAMDSFAFVGLSISLIILFGLSEIPIFIEHFSAVKHSSKIENLIRKKQPLKPSDKTMSDELMVIYSHGQILEAIKNPRFYLNYVFLLPIIFIFWWYFPLQKIT